MGNTITRKRFRRKKKPSECLFDNDRNEDYDVIRDDSYEGDYEEESEEDWKEDEAAINYDEKPTFDTLVEALYDAGIKAQRSVQNTNLHQLETYFTKDENNVLEPVLIQIKVPSTNPSENDWDIINVPLISLTKHNHLKIDKMNVELNFNINNVYKTTTIQTDFHKLKENKWKIRIIPPINNNPNCAKLDIQFTFDQPLESITRLTERYDRFL